jgi:hypothetical protein
MRIMTTHSPLENGMMMGQREFSTFIEMTLETGFRRTFRIDNGPLFASRLIVKTPGSVTRLTTDRFRILTLGLKPSMCRRLEVTCLFLVANGTTFRPCELCPQNGWRLYQEMVGSLTGDDQKSDTEEEDKEENRSNNLRL